MIENELLKQWINEKYPFFVKNNMQDLICFNSSEIDCFANWMQEKLKKSIFIPANTFNAQEDFTIEIKINK